MKHHHNRIYTRKELVWPAFRRTAFVLFIAVFGISLFGATRVLAGDSGNTSHPYQIAIKDFSFQPKLITVPVGTKVVWTNKDEEPHTVVSTDHAFLSKALDTEDQFSFTFDKPGTYEYFCSVHPRMVAKIVVVATKDKQSMKMDKMN